MLIRYYNRRSRYPSGVRHRSAAAHLLGLRVRVPPAYGSFSLVNILLCNNIKIFSNCNWVVTRWQWLFYSIQNMKSVTTKFKSGELHEKHVVATWNLGNHLSICF